MCIVYKGQTLVTYICQPKGPMASRIASHNLGSHSEYAMVEEVSDSNHNNGLERYPGLDREWPPKSYI